MDHLPSDVDDLPTTPPSAPPTAARGSTPSDSPLGESAGTADPVARVRPSGPSSGGSDWWRWPARVLGAVAGLYLLLAMAWAVDTYLISDDVARNVTLADRDVGSLSAAELDAVVAEVAAEYDGANVVIGTPAANQESTAAELGLVVDAEATANEAKSTGGHGGFVLARPVRWVGGLFGEQEAPVVFLLDRGTLTTATADLAASNRTPPVEPTIEITETAVVAVPGQAGQELPIDTLVDDLAAAAREGALPTDLTATPVPVPTAHADSEAQAAADEANRLTGAPLTISAATSSVEVPPQTLRTWYRLADSDRGLVLEPNPGAVDTFLGEAFADLRVEPVDAGFTLGAGGVEITPDATGQACCTDDSATRVHDALDSGAGSVNLDVEILEPGRDLARAQEMGITTPIGSFTTNYPAGQPRVQNIHRIADLVRGAVIEPGETFSVNEYVGPRTSDNGFVSAPVIYRGEYDEDVGGGVSQFATTLFNAGFVSGLDFGEYQSHSIYISRYPRGREATISYPHPDLQIVNNSPYGVMIWTYYTGSSITVELWSTPYVTTEQTGQTERPQGRCTRVTTLRSRTYPDGRVEEDSVYAVYRPGEGVNC